MQNYPNWRVTLKVKNSDRNLDEPRFPNARFVIMPRPSKVHLNVVISTKFTQQNSLEFWHNQFEHFFSVDKKCIATIVFQCNKVAT